MLSTALHNNNIIISDHWPNFTDIEHNTWNILFEQQIKLLKNYAVSEVMDGIEQLNIQGSQIPEISDLNKILAVKTNFSIIPVTNYVPGNLFFNFLAQRKFPVIYSVRKPIEIDYAEEPDLFHDIIGHVPLLTNNNYTDFLQKIGLKYLEAIKIGAEKFIIALTWFTIEFGLIRTQKGLRAYGGGILSSKKELLHCLRSKASNQINYNLLDIIRSQRIFDSFQEVYFINDNFQQLLDIIDNMDLYAISQEYKHTTVGKLIFNNIQMA